MTASSTVLRTQLRHLHLPTVALDTIMMAVVGTLAMFVLLLATFQSADALIFEAGLRYDSREAVETPMPADPSTSGSGVSIRSSTGTSIVAASFFDDPERHPADFRMTLYPTLWRFLPDQLAETENLLSLSVVTGRVSTSGMLLDEASSVFLGVEVGDDIVFHDEDGEECRATLTGILRTYREIGTAFTSGLVVTPAPLCAEVIASGPATASTFLRFDAAPHDASAQSWAGRMWELLGQASDARVSGMLPVIFAVGIGLWGLTGFRMSVRLRRSLAQSSGLLAELGSRRRQVRRPLTLVSAISATSAAFGAAWLAHQALQSFASFYTQTLHWSSTAVLFAAVTTCVAAIAHARADRNAESRRRPSPHSRARRQGNR